MFDRIFYGEPVPTSPENALGVLLAALAVQYVSDGVMVTMAGVRILPDRAVNSKYPRA